MHKREKERASERGRILLTIKKCLKVGKYNALSGNTTSGPSIWQRVPIPPLSERGREIEREILVVETVCVCVHVCLADRD